MRENTVKRRLAAGETVAGLMCFEFGTTGIARLAAAAGADFVLLDTEHTGWGLDTIRGLLAAARSAEIPTFARVPDSQPSSISRLLDLGALGVMVPMVESAEQARAIVRATRYPPLGTRGVGLYYADDVEPDGLPATVAKANREVLLIAQVESVAGVEHVEDIAAVDGIDVLWIGHFDLTTSLGAPGVFWSPAHTAAVERVMAAAASAGLPVGTLANDLDDARHLLERGFRAVVYGDAPLFVPALRAALDGLRG